MTRPPITLAQQIEAIDGIIAECEADSYLASLELVDALRAAAATLRRLQQWEALADKFRQGKPPTPDEIDAWAATLADDVKDADD